MQPFVLGVDLDGVCGDYTAAFREVVSLETARPLDDLTMEVTWDYSEWGLDRDAFLHLHKTGVLDHDMFATMPPIPGAADALWRLSDAGVWIRIVTHRLVTNWGHAKIVSDTVHWLDQHRIPYRDICFLGRKPEVEADCYIDDAVHNVEALRAGGNEVIVFSQPHNRGVDGPRADSWAQVEEHVLALLADRGGVQVQFPGIDPGADRLDRHVSRS